MKNTPYRQYGISVNEILIIPVVFGIFVVVIISILSLFGPSDNDPVPMVKEFMSVAYGGKPSDVATRVEYAPGEREAVVKAEAGNLSCVLDAAVADYDTSPRYGWIVTGAHCVPRVCADGASKAGKDGEPVACGRGEHAASMIEGRSNQAEKHKSSVDK